MGKRKHVSEVTGPGTWVSPSKRTSAVLKVGKKLHSKLKFKKKTQDEKRAQTKNYSRAPGTGGKKKGPGGRGRPDKPKKR
mmetsp:Transcript_7179/g.24849  ORF Transcript_7179/g.24849 Transcript_7179/m.24849 type:complete len:80 (+) Transcript_7179:1572-1811(+)